MNKSIDQLLASMKTLSLKDAERTNTRELLEARIRFPHAFRLLDSAAREVVLLPSEKMLARLSLTEAIHREKTVSGFHLFDLFSLKRFVALFSAVLVVFSTGGSVLAYAAEDSLPGDTLYSVKVSINEPLVALFHRTPEAKARWAGKKLERRLFEAEKLALRDSVIPEIEETITRSIENAEQEVEQNALLLPEEEKREEFWERLKHMKERQRNVVGRFKEKRMKKRVILSPKDSSSSKRSLGGKEEDISAEDRKLVPEGFIREMRKGPKEKVHREKSL